VIFAACVSGPCEIRASPAIAPQSCSRICGAKKTKAAERSSFPSHSAAF
jgi:hypothetical protein